MSSDGAPQGCMWTVATWSGQELLVWGGTDDGGADVGSVATGARYDPVLDRWRPLNPVGAPSARREHAGVWTGTELIVWGGRGFDSDDPLPTDGGRYNPVTDTWRSISQQGEPPPRAFHTAVWSGREMIVFGGTGFVTGGVNVDGAYDPGLNRWRLVARPSGRAPLYGHTAVWIDAHLLVFGGVIGGRPSGGLDGNSTERSDRVLCYDAQPDQWRIGAVADADRYGHSAVAANGVVLIWGGLGGPQSLRGDGFHISCAE